jgi:SAM-dependent methyltransferase
MTDDTMSESPGLTTYYNRFYQADDFRPYPDPVSRRYLRGLLRRSGAPQGARVLDVGCGTGYYTALLRDIGYTARGIDLSEVAIERARRRYPGIRFDVRDAFAEPVESERCDAVFVQGFSGLNTDDVALKRERIRRLMRHARDEGTLLVVGGSTLPGEGLMEGGWYQHSWKQIVETARIPEFRVTGPYATHEYLFLLPPFMALSTLTTDFMRSIPFARRRRIVTYLSRP